MRNLLNKVLGRGQAPATLAPGSVAPDFSVTAHDGSTVNLADLSGQNVVLWFYPKADTPG